jgi:hypothetical protein
MAKTGQGSKTKLYYCECGGLISVKTIFGKGKLMPQAECDKCHKTARHVKDLFPVRW